MLLVPCVQSFRIVHADEGATKAGDSRHAISSLERVYERVNLRRSRLRVRSARSTRLRVRACRIVDEFDSSRSTKRTVRMPESVASNHAGVPATVRASNSNAYDSISPAKRRTNSGCSAPMRRASTVANVSCKARLLRNTVPSRSRIAAIPPLHPTCEHEGEHELADEHPRFDALIERRNSMHQRGNERDFGLIEPRRNGGNCAL